jgi:cytidine deaminase
MTTTIVTGKWEDLDSESQMLIRKAEEALPHAYAPYSKFRVASAILLDNGVVITGTNQENAAYPDGMCAERVALFTKASQYPERTIRKLVVVAKSDMAVGLSPASCCGSCRQVMLEFELRQDKPYEVVMQGREGEWLKAPNSRITASLQLHQKKSASVNAPCHLVTVTCSCVLITHSTFCPHIIHSSRSTGLLAFGLF